MKCRKNYRDKEKYRIYRNDYNKRYYKARQFLKNNKKRWTEEEIQLVMEQKIPDTDIAFKLGRSVKAIQILRCKQRKLLETH